MRLLLALAALLTATLANAGGGFVGTAGKFDYYVLTLSWEPAYCSQPNADPQECSGTNHGFVLHGLWPQMQSGGYPETCPSSFHLDPPALQYQKQNGVFPSEGLLQHEWTTHGTCDGRDAIEYIKEAEAAHASIKIPDALSADGSHSPMTADAISQAFRQANPSLTNRAAAVHCGGKQLKEVQFCLGKDLHPMTCGTGVQTACPKGQLQLQGKH